MLERAFLGEFKVIRLTNLLHGCPVRRASARDFQINPPGDIRKVSSSINLELFSMNTQ